MSMGYLFLSLEGYETYYTEDRRKLFSGGKKVIFQGCSGYFLGSTE